MSLDKSLKSKSALVRKRNVLTRAERIERLEEEEKWTGGQDSTFGLPKVKPHVIAVPKERVRREEPQEEAEDAEPAGEAAESSEAEK